jgi:hypothetical protein
LDFSFNSFKDDVEISFNKVDLSLNKIISDISRLDFSVNNLPNFVDWTIEQTDDIHINNIPDLPYVTEVSLNKVILDLSNLDNSFSTFKLSVENSFNLVDSSLIDIIQDISNLDNFFSTFKLSVENSFNLVDSSLIDIIQDISNLDNSFSTFKLSVENSFNIIDASLDSVFDRVIVIETSLNNIIDDIDDILPDINSSNLAYVLTSTGSTSTGAVWAPVTTLTTNDFFEPESTVVTAASTKGVFDYTQPKIINLDVCDNNYIEIAGADFIVNGDTSLNGILNISGSVFLNGVNLIPSISGDIVLDASRIESGLPNNFIDLGLFRNNMMGNTNSAILLSASHTNEKHVEIYDDKINMRQITNNTNSATNMYLNWDGGNVVVKNDLEVTGDVIVNGTVIGPPITYSAGTGLSLVGTQFQNTGYRPYLSVNPPYNAGAGSPHLSLGANSSNRWFFVYCYYLYYNAGGLASDDRIKHNEKIVTNGLDIITQLTPKKYQKSLKMYDADYNGEIEGTWHWETGLIAQELLKTDISFCVGGGDRVDEETGDLIPETYCVDYNTVFTYSIAAIKELNKIVQSQAELITKLENRITILENS